MSKTLPKNILICPECMAEKLSYNNNIIRCESCGGRYKHSDNKYFFTRSSEVKTRDPLDKMKFIFKNFPRLYIFFVYLISQVYSSPAKKVCKKFLEEYINENVIAVNFGSGNTDISDNVSNIDIFPYKNVDLTSNMNRFPFKDQSVNIIL